MRHLVTLFLILAAGSVLADDYIRIDVSTKGTINQIYFANDQMGWAVTSNGEILSTYDGGQNWKLTKVTTRSIADIHIQGRQAYLVGERGLLMRSTNGGASWEDISLNMKFNFVGVGIANDSSIVIVGTDQNSISKSKGVIFESRDYGKTWKKHHYHLGNGYTDLAIYPPYKVYLLASKKVFHSISQGLRYFDGKYEGSRLGLGFDFIDNYGFMVGYKGLFSRTDTHGRTWTEIPLEITRNLHAVEMFDWFSGVAVGDDGLVIYFYDDGDRHVAENCGETVDLRAVAVTGEKIFFGGEDGVFLYKERFPRYEDK